MKYLPTKINYQVVHANPGRIRIDVPLLKNDLKYAIELQQLLDSLDFTLRVRINPLASSIAIRYDASAISSDLIHEQIAFCIQQAATIESSKKTYTELAAVNPQKETIQKTSENGEKQHTEVSAKDEELFGRITLEVVGEVVGEAVGELLLGSIGGVIASRVMGKVGGLVEESIHRQIADVAGLLEHVAGQANEERVQQLNKPSQYPQP